MQSQNFNKDIANKKPLLFLVWASHFTSAYAAAAAGLSGGAILLILRY